MFPIDTDSLAETKGYIFEELLKRLTRSSRKLRGIDATAEQLEKDKKENREIAEHIAEQRGVQYMYLYAISKSLKNHAYQDLRPLVRSIEAETVTADEMKGLYESIGVLLAQTKHRSEIGSDIKEALRPYIERNSTHMRRGLAEMGQQAQEAEQRLQRAAQARQAAEQQSQRDAQARQAAEQARQEAEQRMQTIIDLSALTYDQIKPNPFVSSEAFVTWRNGVVSKIANKESIDEATQELVNTWVEAYKKSKQPLTHSTPPEPINNTSPFTPSSSSSSSSLDFKSTGKSSKSFLPFHSIDKKRKPNADKENEGPFEQKKLSTPKK